MRADRTMVWLLLLATLAIDAALVAGLPDRHRWPDASVAVLLGMVSGQVILITFWGVLGQRMLPWRLAALVAVPIGWSFALGLSADFEGVQGYETVGGWAVHFLTQATLLASILTLTRLFGGGLRHRSASPSNRSRRRLQFTLGYMFAWLTATAVALGALRSALNHSQAGVFVALDWRGIFLLGVVHATIGLLLAWIVLDARQFLPRAMAIVVTAIPAAWAIGFVSYMAERERFAALILLWFVAAVYSAAAMTVLRVAGYRLDWPAPSEPMERVGAGGPGGK